MKQKERNRSQRRRLNRRGRRIVNNNATREKKDNAKPVLGSQRVGYQVAESAKGTIAGGIGALHRLAVKVGLVGAINKGVKVLKRHVPYWESDHVLSIAFNILCGGTTIEDMELRRSDEALLAVLGARRLPDPTTAGDFCRRFSETDIVGLMDSATEPALEFHSALSPRVPSSVRHFMSGESGAWPKIPWANPRSSASRSP